MLGNEISGIKSTGSLMSERSPINMITPESMNIVMGRSIARRGILIAAPSRLLSGSVCTLTAAPAAGAAAAALAGGGDDAVAVSQCQRTRRDHAGSFLETRPHFHVFTVADTGLHGREFRRHGVCRLRAAS